MAARHQSTAAMVSQNTLFVETGVCLQSGPTCALFVAALLPLP
jgi:hypothetical protein